VKRWRSSDCGWGGPPAARAHAGTYPGCVPEPGVPDPAPRDVTGAEIDPDVIDLATKIFSLARAGDTAAVTAYVDAGMPVNLTNDKATAC
jgi:hypothetical protein